jgi:hypothetical protein
MTDTKVQDWHEAIPLAQAVYRRHAAGCCAHIITDDGNVEQDHADWTLTYAREKGHPDCIALCEVLARMSQTQRQKLYASRTYGLEWLESDGQ